MSETQPILDRILADAHAEADNVIADAQAKAERILRTARESADNTAARAEAAAKKDGAQLIERRRTVAALEVKKIALTYRRNVLDAAFDSAKQTLIEMSAARYGDFLKKLIEENAEYDDEILLSERCPVERSYIMSIPMFEHKKLRLSRENGTFDGGLILVGKTYDKPLTFDNLLALAREKIETEIAGILEE